MDMECTQCLVLASWDVVSGKAKPPDGVACEIRLDTFDLPPDAEALRRRFKVPLIATFRTRPHHGKGDPEDRDGLGWTWRWACAQAGFDAVDLEADEAELEEKIERLHEMGCRVILSHHAPDGTPDITAILSRTKGWQRTDVVKIIGVGTGTDAFAHQRRAYRDWALRNPLDRPALIHFFMGDGFEATRLLSLCYGAPFTFVAPHAGDPMAAGQMTGERLSFLLGRAGCCLADHALFGVLGWPISHSRSPERHLPGLRECRPNTLFLPFPARTAEDLQILRDTFPELVGMAITKPVKEEAFAMFGSQDSHCPSINTWVAGPPASGYNTDFSALKTLIQLRCGETRRARVRVLGYGGLGKAAVRACLDLGLHTEVSNRSQRRLRQLPEGVTVVPWEHRQDQGPVGWIQATSLGMAPHEGESPINHFPSDSVWVIESVYEPPDTAFLKLARLAGLATSDGATFFETQAQLQHRIFRRALAGNASEDARRTRPEP